MIAGGWCRFGIDYGENPGVIVVVIGTPVTGEVYPREMPHISPREFTWRDEPWLIEARQTPRRTKRGPPAMKPAPRRAYRRACY